MTEDHLRLLAAASGLVILAATLWPAVSALPIASLLARRASRSPQLLRDMQSVLDLASRLQVVGKTEAVRICKQLIDEMLKADEPPTEAPK